MNGSKSSRTGGVRNIANKTMYEKIRIFLRCFWKIVSAIVVNKALNRKMARKNNNAVIIP